MSGERERERVHVSGSPTHCPFCKDSIEDLKAVVACAACGARHHQGCYASHGRCATCNATERLVPETRRPRPRGAPLTGSKIAVGEDGAATVYSWEKGRPSDSYTCGIVILVVLVVTIPLAIYLAERQKKARASETPIRNAIKLGPDAIEFTAIGEKTIRAQRADVGRAQTTTNEHGHVSLKIDVGVERYVVDTLNVMRTGSVLKPAELEWLAEQINAWRTDA